MESRWVRGLPADQVKCVFADSVEDALGRLELAPVDIDEPPVVVVRWERPPRIDVAIQNVIEELAVAAQVTWPYWFGQSEPLGPDVPPREIQRLSETIGSDYQWVLEASELAAANQRPLPTGFPNTVTARNLARAIGPESLSIVLTTSASDVGDSASQDPHLDGMCRVAQWLLAQTHGRVCVLLHRSLNGRPEVSSVDFQPWFILNSNGAGAAQQCEPPEGNAICSTTPRSLPSAQDQDLCAAAHARPRFERKLRVWPILGRPHPGSPGEALLATKLSSDPTLAGLFEFNQRVATAHGTHYIVDLLAQQERLVVEIDGYRHHSNRSAFEIDRQRDFELVTSGYLVLRLPHDEVIADTDKALGKMRAFVDFQRAAAFNSASNEG